MFSTCPSLRACPAQAFSDWRAVDFELASDLMFLEQSVAW